MAILVNYTCKSFTNFLKAIIESVYISRGL